MNVDAVLPDRHSSYSIWKSLCSSMHTLRNLTLITLCQTIDGKILPIHYSYCENYFITFTTRAQPKKLLDALVPSALMSTYALPKSHQDVSIVPSASWAPKHGITVLTHYTQLLEKSLVDTDPEIAEIMVCDIISVANASPIGIGDY